MTNDAVNQGPGRRSKCTPELQDQVVELIKAGNYIEVACAAVGISEKSYYNWVAIGRQIQADHGEDQDEWPTTLSYHERRCGEFFQTIKQATAQAEAYAVASIRKQMPTQWAAAMTYLERRFPGRWKRRDEIAVANPFDVQGQKNSAIDEQAMLNDPEAVQHLHAALAAVAKGEGLPELVESTAVEMESTDGG